MTAPSLFVKVLVAFLAVATVPLAVQGVLGARLAYDQQHAALAELQRAQAVAAAERIAQFVRGIEGQLGWVTQLPLGDGSVDAHRDDALRVLRGTPAITDLALVDAGGRERLAVSRLSVNRTGSDRSRGAERAFVEASARRAYYGPVYLQRETEPFMTLAVAGGRPDAGVAIAEVNLKHVWDVVSRIRVGREGRAYVIDRRGRLVAHPDISLVLRAADVSARVAAIVEAVDAAEAAGRPAGAMPGLQGDRVLVSYAIAEPMDWRVVVELPEAEADAPIRVALERAAWIAAGSLALVALAALLAARRLVRPIRALTTGAIRVGSGRLDEPIDIRTGDEIETLGHQFNSMAAQVRASYEQLERKVEERTRELAAANAAKSRFLAAASHDLRQPLHALNLLVAQLRAERDPARRERTGERIEDAVGAINDLFDGLLDLSRLDAGAVAARPTALPAGPLLERIAATFASDARAKGLRLIVAPSRAWVRSDPQLLERVLLNLVGNAVRYTREGGIVVGCRPRGDRVRIEIRDSGIGIPVDRQALVFSEFYQVGGSRTLRGEGLGLGLAIVDRLCRLLEHPIDLRSSPGTGTCVAVTLPRAPAGPPPAEVDVAPVVAADAMRGRRIAVIDDDERVLEGTGGLLGAWGCEVVTATSAAAAIERLGDRPPDLVIADFHLGAGEEGVDAIAAIRRRSGRELPAVLVSGDLSAETRERARALGLPLLDKPVRPMALRALVSRMLECA